MTSADRPQRPDRTAFPKPEQAASERPEWTVTAPAGGQHRGRKLQNSPTPSLPNNGPWSEG